MQILVGLEYRIHGSESAGPNRTLPLRYLVGSPLSYYRFIFLTKTKRQLVQITYFRLDTLK